jgi:RNA polymerase sigma factor (sigma-70 family)
MKRINLKDIYPALYQENTYLDVDDPIADALESFRRLAHAQAQQRSYNKVCFSYLEGMTEDFMQLTQTSPLDHLIESETRQLLYQAIGQLSEKTQRRLIMHFFLDLSQLAIARLEGVHQSSVSRSIEQGICQLKMFFRERYG